MERQTKREQLERELEQKQRDEGRMKVKREIKRQGLARNCPKCEKANKDKKEKGTWRESAWHGVLERHKAPGTETERRLHGRQEAGRSRLVKSLSNCLGW